MNNDSRFVDQVKKVLDDSTNQLDQDISQRLKAARHQALAQKAAPRRRAWLRQQPGLIWILGSTCAGIVVLAVSLMINWNVNLGQLLNDDLSVKRNNSQPGYTLEMLASEEAPEFYDEMEFYQWLSEKESSNAS